MVLFFSERWLHHDLNYGLILVMNTEEAINLAGSQAMLARILGVSCAAVLKFKKAGVLPDLRAVQLYAIRPEWFAGRPVPTVGQKFRTKAEANQKAKA